MQYWSALRRSTQPDEGRTKVQNRRAKSPKTTPNIRLGGHFAIRKRVKPQFLKSLIIAIALRRLVSGQIERTEQAIADGAIADSF